MIRYQNIHFTCNLFRHSVDYSLTHSLSARARFEKSLQLASCYLLINAEGKRGTTDPVFCVNKHSFQWELGEATQSRGEVDCGGRRGLLY